MFPMLLAAAISQTMAAGPSIPFLEPSRFRAAADQPITLTTTVIPIGGDRVEHAFILCESGRTNLDDFFSGPITLPIGSALIGCQYAPVKRNSNQVTGLLNAFGFPPQEGREVTVIRSSAALIAVGEGGGSMASVRSGMSTEIRPMSDPTSAIGGDLALRFYGRAQKAAKAAPIRATHVPSGKTLELRTDQGGVVDISLKPGVWRIAGADLDADVLSIATLTFEVKTSEGRR